MSIFRKPKGILEITICRTTLQHNGLNCEKKYEKSVSIFLNIICRKGLGNFLCSLYRLQMTTKSCKKVAPNFECKSCDYVTCKKSSYNKHILTAKHITTTNDYKNTTKSCEKVAKVYTCNCGKSYLHHSSLWKHKSGCKEAMPIVDASNNNIIIELLKQNQEFKELIVEQNKQMIVMASKMGSNTNSGNTNCNNKTNNFNLQFFLNETCKDALNIDDFVNQIKLQLGDLDMIGRVGYTEGMSKIFLRNLKELDVNKRPIHCSDLKRETLYVKDKDAWEKENTENVKIKKAIKGVENKNIKQLPQWREENPSSQDTETKKHMDYQNILLEAMGGSTSENDDKKHDKIVKNIAKEVVIDKEKV